MNYFSSNFIEQMMRLHAPQQDIRVLEVQPLAVDNSASILAVLTANHSDRLIGHFGLAVTFEAAGTIRKERMVMKVKPHGQEIVEMLNHLATACGGHVAAVYPAFKQLTGFQHTHRRELEVYGKLPSALTPEIFGLYADEENGAFIILMEYLEDVQLLNSVMAPEQWTDKYIKTALEQIAVWHASHLQRELPIDKVYWDDVPSQAYMRQLQPLWQALLQNAGGRFPELYPAERVSILQDALEHTEAYWQELEKLPKTLIHNDLNPRNTCFKVSGNSLNFCVYDWELATLHVPQYDVMELLCFVLDEDRYHLREMYLEHYRQKLNEQTGMLMDEVLFKKGFALAALDFGLHRLGMYMMAHTVNPYPFLPRVVNSYFNTLEQHRNYLSSLFSKSAYVADS